MKTRTLTRRAKKSKPKPFVHSSLRVRPPVTGIVLIPSTPLAPFCDGSDDIRLSGHKHDREEEDDDNAATVVDSAAAAVVADYMEEAVEPMPCTPSCDNANSDNTRLSSHKHDREEENEQ
jgi:hypothetical protein